MIPLRVAVLGAGSRAHDHLSTLSRLQPLCTLVGVADSDHERATQAGGDYDIPAFTDLESLLRTTRPDLLYVIIHPDGHRAATEIAAQHGVHVVSETPIAPTLPLADLMIAATQRHGVALEVAENVWRWPNERLKMAIIRAGLIGRVTQLHLWYSSGSYHGISIARTLIDSTPTRVFGFARETPIPPQFDRDGRRMASAPYELGLVEFASGALCVYQYPLSLQRKNYWEVIGTEGAILGNELLLMRDGVQERFPIQQQIVERDGAQVMERVLVETDPPVIWENPLRHLPTGPGADEIGRADILAGMYAVIREGADPAYGAANARNDQEVLLALRESAQQGGVWLDLPLTGTTKTEELLHEDFQQRYGQDPLGPAEMVYYPWVNPAELARGRRYS